jgi:hypothetical protein
MSGSLSAVPAVNISPSVTQTVLPTNYLSTFDFTNQYMPDLYEEEFERYGNRKISGFLKKLGAEFPFASDMIKWEEQGRLHIKYTAISIVYGGGNDTAVCTIADPGITACAFRVNQVVFLSSNTNTTSDHAVITAVAGLTFTVAFYAAAGGTILAADTITAFAYGSEFKKGSNGMQGSLQSTPNIFEVSPVIIKDKYEIDGSTMAQIGWVKITTEEGKTGYCWFIKSESETRERYDDYMEMMLVEHVPAEAGSGAAAATGDTGNKGTQGLFDAIDDRGNVWGGGNPTSLIDWDTVIQRLDKQGSIVENALFVNRQFSTDIDDMLAAQSSGGFGGISWGLFDNDENMALNLGFKGFKRSGYEFYKSDWDYLNDPTLRGGINGGAVNGVLVPAGTMTIKDKVLGQNLKRPFLHVRYRANEHEDRRAKSWITGGAGGAATDDYDIMRVNYLTERCLVTLGANNFFKFNNY